MSPDTTKLSQPVLTYCNHLGLREHNTLELQSKYNFHTKMRLKLSVQLRPCWSGFNVLSTGALMDWLPGTYSIYTSHIHRAIIISHTSFLFISSHASLSIYQPHTWSHILKYSTLLIQSLYSLSAKTSCRQISCSLGAARLVAIMVASFWKLKDISTTLLSINLWNFRAIEKV